MKRTYKVNGGYTAPAMKLYSVKVESGYQASMPGVTINPWESESDSLQF